MYEKLEELNIDNCGFQLRKIFGYVFYNILFYIFKKLLGE